MKMIVMSLKNRIIRIRRQAILISRQGSVFYIYQIRPNKAQKVGHFIYLFFKVAQLFDL